MIKKTFLSIFAVLTVISFSPVISNACTNLLVTRGASVDGSTTVTYTCDDEFYSYLGFTPGGDHSPGDSIEVTDWGGKVIGKVAQVSHTYNVIGLRRMVQGMMNEYQVAIGETTFGGRGELVNENALLWYWNLIELALQRAKTAREAIEVMAQLVDEYGYRSSGESFSISDKKEVWLLEMVGPGKGGKGAIWVALRVPDGYICAHANQSRIGEFPLKDPKNCMYSPNVISYAIEKGYYDPKSGKPFMFYEAYNPPNNSRKRYCDTRVWELFRRAAPSLNLSPDYHRGVAGAKPYPLWIKPDKKLSIQDIFNLMRTHYEGTDYDMTKGLDAGEYGSPYRYRPLQWKVDGVDYVWERPISTQQTSSSLVSQSRSWLPDGIGGVLWFGLDDAYMSCYIPLYCSIDSLPKSFSFGTLADFSWDSAWWIFNTVANYTRVRYSLIIPEVKAVQSELESNFFAFQPAIDKAALELNKKDPALMKKFLTNYCVSNGEMVKTRWQELAEHLFQKYNDGYMIDGNGVAKEVGYPEEWLRRVVKERPEQFLLRKDPAKSKTAEPVH